MTPQPHIVVLGSGFAAIRFAREASRLPVKITLVSPRNHFLFTPLLPSTTVGTVEFRSVIEAVRTACPDIEYVMAEAVGLNTETQILNCQSPQDHRAFTLSYDELVISVGAKTQTFGIEGVSDYALFLKEVKDAKAIRQRLLDNLESASIPGVSESEKKRLLHVVVVGGGPTGVEFAAELNDFLARDIRKAYGELAKDMRITLIEAGQELLGSFDDALSAYTLKHFQRQAIEVMTGARVTRVEQDRLWLKSGLEIAYGLLVWATGNSPSDFVSGLPFTKDREGRIRVNGHLQVIDVKNVFALGDCSSLEIPLPGTGQVAEQQGRYLAKSLATRLRGQTPAPFKFNNHGMLAYIGDRHALVETASIKSHGFLTFLFWRSVYLTKLVSLRNKVLVLFDWARTAIFGRDLSRT